jgi:ABC-type bacteriocin/lantibiotic exporter with double-glycine peptidase domain/CRP-like cAMP-binding protein
VTVGTKDVAVEDLALLEFVPPDVRPLVTACFEPQTYRFGEVIVREGADADAFYVLTAGRARVVKQGADGQEVTLAMLGPGDSFGETGLLDDSTRTATVRASGDVEALRLDRSLFAGLLSTAPELREAVELHRRRVQLEELFRLYTVFAELPPAGLETLLHGLEEVTVDAGAVVIEQDRPPGAAYVVEEGRLRTRRDGRDLAFHRRGDVVGERSLFTDTPRAATVEAVSDARLLRLPAGLLRSLLATYPDFAERLGHRIAQYDYETVARVPLDFGEELLPADAQRTGEAPPAAGSAGAGAPTPPEPDAVPFDPDGQRPPKRRRLRVPLIHQIDEMDCGAACLAMVCTAYGRPISLTRARDAADTDLSGSSLAGIVRGAAQLGFDARTVKASKRNLDDLPLPAIAHWDGFHWLVVTEVSARRVRVVDPDLGRRRLSREEFEERWSGYTALLEPTPALEGRSGDDGVGLGWMRGLLSRHRGRLLTAVLLALVASGLQMAMPVFLQIIVDDVLPARDVQLLRILLLAMVGVLAALAVATIVHRYLLSWVALRVDGASMDVLSQRLLALPMSYFNTRRTGDIQRRLSGVQQIRMFAVQDGLLALTAFTQLSASLVIMVLYSPLLAAVYVAVTPVYAGLMRFGATRLRPIFDQLEESFGRYYSRQVDAVKGIEAVKAMGAEPALRRELVEEFKGLSQKLFRADLGAMLYHAGVRLVAFASLILFLWVGSRLVLGGTISVGALVSFSALVVFANNAIIILLSLWDQGQRVSVLLRRVRDVFEVEPEQGRDHSHLAPVPSLSGHVRLEGVGFRYGAHGAPVLADIDLDVAPGTTVALVGRSGSGKTTLAKCLIGLLEPTEGTVRYDGVDMTTLAYRDLRRHIGVVLQDNYVFADTIARNIAFGEPEPDLDRVRWAARAANAHDFIVRLPLGYETRVGETGLQLSGGQKQRIAIARAVYLEPSVLILDEATSALDAESEQAVQESLDRLLEQRTSFVIAHRLSTIRDADTIVVLDKGRIAEQGGHDELMARRGLYFYLNSRQLDL